MSLVAECLGVLAMIAGGVTMYLAADADDDERGCIGCVVVLCGMILVVGGLLA